MEKKATNNHQIYYQPKNVWVGDIMPYANDGKFYIYHQRDQRVHGPITDPFGWALATTKDFVNYQDYGESLKRGSDQDWDQFVYAGSVFEANGTIHAFYTGYNKEFLQAGKTSQILLHATSNDFIHWKKSINALKLTPQPGYDIRNWRDPSVIWDERKQEYLLILGARKGKDKHKLTGRLVKYTSKDLENWQFEGDFWAPNLYTMFEMPQLFQMGDWWYLVYSEYSVKNKVFYRMSKSLDGPWLKPKDEAFDGRAYYAARTAFDGKRRVLFGWVPTKLNEDDMSNYEWGGTFVPQEVYQRRDKTLGVRPIAEICEAFTSKQKIPAQKIGAVDTLQEKTLVENTGYHFYFHTTISFSESTTDFSIRLYKNNATDESYEFRFNLDENQLTLDKNPCYRWYQMMDKGLNRPINLEANQDYDLKVIVDDNILSLYLDGVALNTRVYHKFGTSLALTATNGNLSLSNIEFSNKYQNAKKG
ncbi:family 43 glycosylhydrolase [Lactobacillus xylocopicola]|uniref:beta-fructofuranosidase n=1 Tax=Lactobacillus xylocopicola TaxID=2976676 RepID=A0ABM8BF13_9LACO|nr:family 43 glycosylhydrolase [Lactobacillus xylocopicola]BDR59839.1 beta-fructofuranosidase [Lactobacillus xylocopicola]